MSELVDRAKAAEHMAHANFLYRSGIEIYRMMDAICRESNPLYTEIGDDMFLVTRILAVDADAKHFIVAYGEDKQTNHALFDHGSLVFNVNYHGAQIVFDATDPVDILFNGQAAISFGLPATLFVYHHREYQRVRIPADVSLRCIVDEAGTLPFEARIVDISLDGIGFMTYSPGISLPVGSLLRNCRIILPNAAEVLVDLVVHHSTTIKRKDGTLVIKTGVRFIQNPEEIKALIDMFIKDIDE